MPEGDLEFWSLVDGLTAMGVSERDILEPLCPGRLEDDYTAHFTEIATDIATGRCECCTVAEAVRILQTKLRETRGDQAAPTKREADGDGGDDDDERDGAASAIPVSEPAGRATPPTPTKPHQQPMSNPTTNVDDSATKQVADADKKTHTADAPPTATPDKCSDFATAVAQVVEKFGRKDVVPTGYATPKLPGGRTRLTLSEWYRAVEKAYPPPSADTLLKQDQAARAKVLCNEVRRVFGETESRVSLWMLDGAGHIVFQLLAHLLTAGWTDEQLDARLELSLVDWNKDMNDYHEWAIPCATVRRGNIHKLIEAARVAGALPQVVYFNYSITTTDKTKEGMYEEGSWPGAKYSTSACMKHTAASCKTVLDAFPQAGLLVSFSATRAAGKNGQLFCIEVAKISRLKAAKILSNRNAFETWQVTSTPRQQAAAADDSSSSDAVAQDGAASAAGAPAGSDKDRFDAVVNTLEKAGVSNDAVVTQSGVTLQVAPDARTIKVLEAWLKDTNHFYELVDKLLVSGMTKTAVVKLLGYAGNADRSFTAIVERRSKTCTLPKAIELLDAELEKKR